LLQDSFDARDLRASPEYFGKMESQFTDLRFAPCPPFALLVPPFPLSSPPSLLLILLSKLALLSGALNPAGLAIDLGVEFQWRFLIWKHGPKNAPKKFLSLKLPDQLRLNLENSNPYLT
jgi:hypothetical protein